MKPGRPHENGIRNQHVKFPDGTEIELITTNVARDPLTAEYFKHLASGGGPAFVGFYAPDMNQLAILLDAEARTYRFDNGLLTFPESDQLRYIFFGNRYRSPTDQPEHFEHFNGAEALIGIWIAGDDLAPERQLFTTLGATMTDQEVYAPERMIATVARLPTSGGGISSRFSTTLTRAADRWGNHPDFKFGCRAAYPVSSLSGGSACGANVGWTQYIRPTGYRARHVA